MTVPWTADDVRQAAYRYGEYFRLLSRDPKLGLATSVADIRRFKTEGRVGLIFGCQNARILEENLDLVEVYHRIGVRVNQLTYNERNFIGDGCVEPTNAGLSRFGRRVVAEMNRVGIQIDLTHVGERSSLEALELSEKPCIFSHSNPRRRAENVRNLTDEQIKLCAERGGVIGVSSWPAICWTGGPMPPTLEDLVGHVEYLADLVGADHISVGTDSEATPGAYPQELKNSLTASYGPVIGRFRAAFPEGPRTKGFESMEDLPNLTHALLNRGWSVENVRKVLGENLLRAYGTSWG